ncbi:uncharacterized protein TRIADDRAFT_33521 [Trichoplax adhaerens]|uniref:Uncharacterized protein n=1 Tax=Trichoplax adhaerens TaxID=10228 RepID=B3SCS5_TRIAD|nr:hypothetical protein TRIADDRAFT_33521 [Trichoplax adhaerens]EDV19460.1 hypothetical protein TRIADDRAFT_33521 [Trichoplax adhaerens]|eukprot:XP_002118060.1 hypothetical protein TRIADDRAFT_33521 [Trichoplax adhaerens]
MQKIDDDDHHLQDVKNEPEQRTEWSSWIEFFLSCVGYAVGIGNIARFPYLCYKNGGGNSLLHRIFTLTRQCITFFVNYHTIHKGYSGKIVITFYFIVTYLGLGYAMMVISGWVAIYYNMLIAWSLYYLYSSFAPVLPWSTCNNTYNSPYCFVDVPKNGSLYNIPAIGEFLNFKVLELDLSFQISFALLPHLVVCLLIAWIITYFSMFMGVKSSGKVVYFTATFPYIVLIAFLIRGVTLPGAVKGIEYYIVPNFTKLAHADPWVDAVGQIFYSYGIGFGSLIAMGSYNKFNNRIQRDAFYVILANSGTSIFAGFVVFAILGFLAEITNTPVAGVVTEGIALALVAYPQAIAKLPSPHVWAIIFFIMLMTLGMDSMFGMIEAVSTGISDRVKNRITKRKPLMVLIICICFFLIGLICATKASVFVVSIMDKYCGGRSLMLVVLLETIAISWVYGANKFSENIEEMTGSRVFIGWKFCWMFLCPACLLVVFVLSIVQDQPLSYAGVPFPGWTLYAGVGLSLTSFLFVPIVAIYRIIKENGSFSEVP